VFTQTTLDAKHRPIQDPDATTYCGAIEGTEEFGRRLFSEAHRRVRSRAETKVVLADGAIWIWTLADLHFPGAIQIVDLYHARKHLWDLAAQSFPNQPLRQQRWVSARQKRLDNGRIESLVTSLRTLISSHPGLAQVIAIEAEYFARNAERMRYPDFRRQNLFVGSGVVEAACKTVIGSRLKQSGMFWTLRGANAIITLRCCRLSGRFEDYWENRAA
jgi:hypothetical protein